MKVQNDFGSPARFKIALAVWRDVIPASTVMFNLLTGLCQIS